MKKSRKLIFMCQSYAGGKNRVGLYGQGRFLGLGIAEKKSDDGLKVMTPIVVMADKVEFSSVKFEG